MRFIAAALILGCAAVAALAQDAAVPRAAIEEGFKKAEAQWSLKMR
jgi:hypothetical protein